MKVSVCGLGKLGKPVALAMALQGHDVMGYDIDVHKMCLDYPHVERGPDGEPSIVPLLKQSGLRFGSLEEVIAHGEIIFVVVQTPHAPKYEGITRLPKQRKDFDYSYLRVAVKRIAACAEGDKVLAVISTCTPGTIDRVIRPLLPDNLHLAHTPFFEAMGTVVSDFLNREFVLIGTEDEWAEAKLREFFATITDAPQVAMSVADAEAVKVFYNTFVTSKIIFANTVMEACHK
jgi:UDPglucose 6-dehydrogenase